MVELAVKKGDQVKQGQIIATIGDEKLALQRKSLDAQIDGLEAQFAKAQTDLTRAEDLFSHSIIPQARLDETRTALNVASNALKARTTNVLYSNSRSLKAACSRRRPPVAFLSPCPLLPGRSFCQAKRFAPRGGTEFRAEAARAGTACPLS